MKLNYITLMVRNMEQSLAFYQELAGLHIVRQIEPPMGKIAFLANAEGETMLELIDFAASNKVETKGMVLSFFAADALAPLRSRALALGYAPSELIAGGQKPAHFTVSDPDGITVEFSN